MPEIIRDYWHIIGAAIGAVIFVVRMEGRTSFHAVELERLQRQRDADQEAAQRSRDETHRMLHDMNAKLDRLIERQLK